MKVMTVKMEETKPVGRQRNLFNAPIQIPHGTLIRCRQDREIYDELMENKIRCPDSLLRGI